MDFINSQANKKFPRAYANSMFCIILLSFLFATSDGLYNSGSSSFYPRIVRACNQTKPCCIQSCRVRFFHRGTWNTALDIPSSQQQCNEVCAQHYNACKQNCDSLTSVSSFSKFPPQPSRCKCTIPKLLMMSVNTACLNKCTQSRNNCYQGCIKQKCVVASTRTKFIRTVKGRCRKRKCPVCIGLNCIAENDTCEEA